MRSLDTQTSSSTGRILNVVITTWGQLKKLLQEEVDRNLRWSAGMVGGGMNGAPPAANLVEPPPGLGSETDDCDGLEIGCGEEQERPQIGLRTLDREG